MAAKVAKIAIRVVATIAGLGGLYGVYFSVVHVPFMLEGEFSSSFAFVFAAISLVLDAWFIWIAYLAWFRFSPLAVKQTCGFLGVLGYGLFKPLFESLENLIDGEATVLFLGWLAFLIVGYRLLSRYLIRVIFSEPPVTLDSKPPLSQSSS